MPELPEVEIAARNLRRWLGGKRVSVARFAASPVLRRVAPRALQRLLVGRTVGEIERRGKWIRIGLSGGAALYSHLGMTGKWIERPRAAAAERFERARIEAGRTSVRYLDPRLFGRLVAAPDGAPPPAWQALGPDPLADGIDPERLRAVLGRTRRAIKEALLDQRVLAGIGNIQAAEALWRARLDPRTPASALDRRRVRALARAILATIEDTLEREDGPEITYVEEPGAENPFDVYGKHGQPCPRCRARLVRLIQAGRSTVYCPTCQR